MKKMLLIFVLFVVPCNFCNASLFPEIKQKIEIIEAETNTYSGEKISLEERIKNIELYVFGETKTGNIEKRLENISKSLGISFQESIAKTSPKKQQKVAKQTEKDFNEDFEENTKQKNKTTDFAYYSPKTVQDKEFNNLEKKLLGKNYRNDNLSERLSRVEMKIFQRKFDYEDDETRLERLKSVQKAAKSDKEYKVNKFAKYAVAGAQIGGLILLILAMIL